MMRSLPEKTLEHWVSLYLASRFPRAEQWWPSAGEDITLELAASAGGPGKVLMLELKVPEVTPAGYALSIEVAQLQNYLSRRLPVFYVIPMPFWCGSLGGTKRYSSQWPGHIPGGHGPEGWWRRRAQEEWFGYWTYVLPANGVAAQINMTRTRSILYSGQPDPYLTGSGLRGAQAWLDFWWSVQRCGPAEASRWRIRRLLEPPFLEISDLLDDRRLNARPPGQETESVLRDRGGALRVRRGQSVVVLHIDEESLRP